MHLKEELSILGNIFLPKLCLNCGDKIYSEKFLCINCQEKMKFLEPPLCRICSHPLRSFTKTGLCKECYLHRPNFDKAISIFRYEGVVKNILCLFKYNFYTSLIELFEIEINKRTGILERLDIEEVTYVPMHPLKLKDREYNSAYLISESLSKQLKKPLEELLGVKKLYKSQVGLSRTERMENVKDKFFLKKKPKKRVLLVDDILTTCSTTSECARVLKEGGAEKVFVFTLARDEISE